MAEFITDSNDNHSESTPAPPKVGLDMYLLLNLLRNYWVTIASLDFYSREKV